MRWNNGLVQHDANSGRFTASGDAQLRNSVQQSGVVSSRVLLCLFAASAYSVLAASVETYRLAAMCLVIWSLAGFFFFPTLFFVEPKSVTTAMLLLSPSCVFLASTRTVAARPPLH